MNYLRTMTAIFVATIILFCAAIDHSVLLATDLPAAGNLPAAVLGDDETVDPEAPNVVIEAPSTVKVGDMIVVDVSTSNGGGFDWEVVPEPLNMRIFNDGKVMCAATGPKSVEYLFIVSCAHNGKSDVKTHTVIVVGSKPLVPDRPGENVAEKVLAWCAGVESPMLRDDALKLAQSFASLATVIESGAFDTPNEIVIATKTTNRDALGDNLQYWVPLFDGLMVELKAMAQVGMLPDAISHAPVWKAVAEGLSTYANQL